ncbi:hypothetical protein B0H14DRAFT_3523410 [Mycena olivaceomarginata]|nr:hypothetical protein B0H14DRAFT_3523410 [Mycena olivaceomarginata]
MYTTPPATRTHRTNQQQPTCIRIRIAMHTLRCIHHLRLRVGALAYAAAHATQRSRVITTSRGRARPSRPSRSSRPSCLSRIASHGSDRTRSGSARTLNDQPQTHRTDDAPLYFYHLNIPRLHIDSRFVSNSARRVPARRVPASAEALSRLTFFFSRIEALTNACLPRTLNIYRLLLSPFRFSAPPNPNPNPNPMPCYSNCPMLLIIVLLTSSALPFYPLIEPARTEYTAPKYIAPIYLPMVFV